MAQGLSALAALTEDPGLIPSTHLETQIHLTSVSGDSLQFPSVPSNRGPRTCYAMYGLDRCQAITMPTYMLCSVCVWC